jgi:hypothetical protein
MHIPSNFDVNQWSRVQVSVIGEYQGFNGLHLVSVVECADRYQWLMSLGYAVRCAGLAVASLLPDVYGRLMQC